MLIGDARSSYYRFSAALAYCLCANAQARIADLVADVEELVFFALLRVQSLAKFCLREARIRRWLESLIMKHLVLRSLLTTAAFLLALHSTPVRAMTQQMEQQAVQFQQQQNWQGLADLASHAVSTDQKDGEAWYDVGLADDGLKRPVDAIIDFCITG
jgi:hypothetical protein